MERSGAERVFQRIGQEYGAKIHAVDVANTADAAHCIIWKRNGWLAPYLPEDVAKHYDKAYYDPDGLQHRDAHPGLADRLQHQAGEEGRRAEELQGPARSEMGGQDGQGASRLFSGTIMNATQQIARDLGWDYFEKLARQKVMQVQSATDTPKKIQLGERAVMVDGAGYLVIRYKEEGSPVEIVYPEEGTPLATGPSVVFKARAQSERRAAVPELDALARGAAVSWSTGRASIRRTARPWRSRACGRSSDIKLMKEDPAAVEKEAESIKKRYAQIFKV